MLILLNPVAFNFMGMDLYILAVPIITKTKPLSIKLLYTVCSVTDTCRSSCFSQKKSLTSSSTLLLGTLFTYSSSMLTCRTHTYHLVPQIIFLPGPTLYFLAVGLQTTCKIAKHISWSTNWINNTMNIKSNG